MFSKTKKLISVVLSVALSSMLLLAAPVQAANPGGGTASPDAYIGGSFSFVGSYSGGYAYYDGNYMAVQAKATSSDGVTYSFKLKVYVARTNSTHTYTMYTDGVYRQTTNIIIGTGSQAQINATCSASATITVDYDANSWYNS